MKNFSSGFCRRCLQQSLSVELMVRFAQLIEPDYDIYKSTGMTEGMPISNQSAAQHIVIDMIRKGRFIDFVEKLIRINADGYMGRSYTLKGLNDVIAGIIQEGYSFDKTTGQFFENQQERITPNWGRLLEGDEHRMTVLRLDIAGNSILVRENPRDRINAAYNELRTIVARAVTKRLGRLWSWEGDGALAVFMFGSIEKMAIYAGMEIFHELFFYNRTANSLKSPIKLRIGVHIGDVRYSDNAVERLKSETIKQALALESRAALGDSMAVSFNLFMSMDQNLISFFTPEKTLGGSKYRLYKVGLEKS
jgi:hypothetical protein